MALTINHLGPKALELKLEGVLRKDDYAKFVPLAESRIQENGKINLLIHVSELSGFSPAALWEDLKFDIKHYRDVWRLAIVGEDDKKKWLASLARPFTAANVEFYPEHRLEEARLWVAATDGGATAA